MSVWQDSSATNVAVSHLPCYEGLDPFESTTKGNLPAPERYQLAAVDVHLEQYETALALVASQSRAVLLSIVQPLYSQRSCVKEVSLLRT